MHLRSAAATAAALVDAIRNVCSDRNTWRQWPTNCWIELDDGCRVYVRMSMRARCGGQPVKNCLDVATVALTDAKCGRGVFTAMMRALVADAAAAGARYEMVFVENVLSEWLRCSLERCGWVRAPHNPGCFFSPPE